MTEWIIIVRQIVGSGGNWQTTCRWDLERYATKSDAIAAGWRKLDHDDFNLGEVEGDRLAWFGWMNEELETDRGEVARQLSLNA